MILVRTLFEKDVRPRCILAQSRNSSIEVAAGDNGVNWKSSNNLRDYSSDYCWAVT